MAITHIVAARLTDQRVQVWASKDDGSAWSLWKTGLDPDSSWTPWQPFTGNTPRTAVVGAGELSNGANQIFGLAAQPLWPQANLTRWKVSADSNAAWSDWVGLGFDGGCAAVTAQQLPDARMQIFALSEATQQGRLRVLTRWKTGTASDAGFSAVVDMSPPGLTGLTSIVALRLSDGRIQLVGGTNDGLLTTWKETVDPNAAWLPWMEFASNPTVRSTTRLAWAPLPDGRPQVWSVNQFGTLSSTWKVSVDPNSAWTQWPTFDGAPPDLVDIAAERLSDGRIQLWAADRAGALFSTWKVTSHPDAAWQPWQSFVAP
jgi:hypothetical protein